jgi:2-phospho-L-lactate guanylyltransferase
MKRWVIVPVKRLTAAKSRLQPALSARQRRILAGKLLDHTLKVLRGLKAIEGILVVSKDRAVLAAARKFGALSVPEGKCDGLNRALTRAAAEAVVRGAEAVMVLPADLPLLSTEDLIRAMRMANLPPFVVVAPDRAEQGTNLLYMAPPGVVRFSFGQRSFQKHRQAARRAGVEPAICRRPALAHDIDRPEDLEDLNRSRWESQTKQKAFPRKRIPGRKSRWRLQGVLSRGARMLGGSGMAKNPL